MRAVVRAYPWLAGFTLAYLVVFLVAGIAIGSEVAVPYVVLILLLILLVCRLEARFSLGQGVLWALSVWGLGHLCGGVIPLDGDRTLYNAVLGIDLLHFDRVVHAFGFGTATLVCGKVLRAWVGGGEVGTGQAALAVLAGLGVGGANEIVEFIATLVLPDTNVGGYVNTGWDLIFDLLGGLVAGWWLVRSSRGRSVQATQAGRSVQATQAGHAVQATQAGHGVQATQAGRSVQATQAGHGVQATQAGSRRAPVPTAESEQ